MAISSITPATTSPAYTAAPASSSSSATTTDTATIPGAPTPSTSVTLSTLSGEAGIVATLGGTSDGFQTYDATGLLNLVAQANTAAAGATAPSPDQATGASDTPDGAATPATTATPVVPGDWGSILKSNPGLTSVAVADAVAQGIVNTIDVHA